MYLLFLRSFTLALSRCFIILSSCVYLYVHSRTVCARACTYLVPRCITIHCQTPPLDCSMIDSAEFQNRNAICCTYNRSYRSWQRLVIFKIWTNPIERRNRVNVQMKENVQREKKENKKRRREREKGRMWVFWERVKLQKWVCEWVNILHAGNHVNIYYI